MPTSRLGVGLEVAKLPSFTGLSKRGHGAFDAMNQLAMARTDGRANPDGNAARPVPDARGRHAVDAIHELECAPKSWRQRGWIVRHELAP